MPEKHLLLGCVHLKTAEKTRKKGSYLAVIRARGKKGGDGEGGTFWSLFLWALKWLNQRASDFQNCTMAALSGQTTSLKRE